MDKDIAKDKNIKKKKPKTKTKVKPRQTQTQSQKVIVNLQDVKRRRTKTRRTRATPQQPQVIYQQAPMPPQQDLNSIVRDQLSRLVPQRVPQPVVERRVEQIEKPELVKTEMPKTRDFNFTPVNIDRPLRLEQPDFNFIPVNIDRPLRLEQPDFNFTPVNIDRPLRLEQPDEPENIQFKRTSVPKEATDFKPVGIPQEVGPIKSATLAAEEPEEDNDSLATYATSEKSELQEEDNVSDATSATSEGSELQEEDNESEGSEVSEGFERSEDKETRLLEEQIILENELRNAQESVEQITQRNNTGNLKGADKKRAAAELREAKSNRKEKQDRLKILKKELKQVMQETSVPQPTLVTVPRVRKKAGTFV